MSSNSSSNILKYSFGLDLKKGVYVSDSYYDDYLNDE